MNQTFTIVLGSAAIGAIVSTTITLIGQAFERHARAKELLFTKAIEMANANVALLQDFAKHTNQQVDVRPIVVYARWHYHQLSSLFSKGKLTDDLEREYAKDLQSKFLKN